MERMDIYTIGKQMPENVNTDTAKEKKNIQYKIGLKIYYISLYITMCSVFTSSWDVGHALPYDRVAMCFQINNANYENNLSTPGNWNCSLSKI